MHFCAVVSYILQPTGKASDIISGRFVAPDCRNMPLKYRDPRLNRSREVPPEVVGGVIFGGFFRDDFRLEVVSDVMSGTGVEYLGVEVFVKFGDSRSNGSRDI